MPMRSSRTAPSQHHLQGHEADAVAVQHLVGEVAGGVRDHDRALRDADREEPVLLAHVVGLGVEHLAPRHGQVEEPLRLVGVDVHAEQVLGPHDLHRPAEVRDGEAHRRGAGEGGAPHQHLGAEPEVLRLLDHDGGGGRAPDQARHLDFRQGMAVDQPHHPFEHPDEALPPGVHDAGTLQDREQLGGALERLLGVPEGALHDVVEVLLLLRRGLRALRRGAADGEDRCPRGDW